MLMLTFPLPLSRCCFHPNDLKIDTTILNSVGDCRRSVVGCNGMRERESVCVCLLIVIFFYLGNSVTTVSKKISKIICSIPQLRTSRPPLVYIAWPVTPLSFSDPEVATLSDFYSTTVVRVRLPPKQLLGPRVAAASWLQIFDRIRERSSIG